MKYGPRSSQVLFEIFTLLGLLLLCSVFASAHGGRTDANGGHTDSSTGEYHYHHGYPAHQHEDLDGDGEPDCPYDFDDRTGERSGSNGSSGTRTSVRANEKETQVAYVPGWMYFALFAAVGAIAILTRAVVKGKRRLRDAKAEFDEKYEKQRKDAAAACEKRVQQAQTACEERMERAAAEYEHRIGVLLREQEESSTILGELFYDLEKQYPHYLYHVAGAEPGDSISYYGLPQNYTESYTFYITGSPNRRKEIKYHARTCRYARNGTQVNAYTIRQHRERYVPCTLCNPVLPSTAWVDKYFRYKRFVQLYWRNTEERQQ